MGGGFKTRKIPRELMLDPPPRRIRWKVLFAMLLLGIALTCLFTARSPATSFDTSARMPRSNAHFQSPDPSNA